MRSFVVSHRFRFLLRAASVGVLGGLISGCSSGFSRFDTSVYESAVPQNTVAQSSNPYPDDIDATTTAGINRRIVPASPVAPKVTPQAVYHQAEPTYVAQTPVNYQPTTQANQVYIPPATQNQQGIQRASLPQAVAYQSAGTSTDSITTSSVTSSPSVTRDNGWTSTGGTMITVQPGETLYNLSKRYGVPVSALKSANNIGNANSLRAGQQILIPNYVYSSKAPVSAPDNNPNTRAARASTGLIGEANASNVQAPTPKPVTASGQSIKKLKQQVNASSDYQSQESTLISASDSMGGSIYTVKSGDSLSRIGKQHGVSVYALQRHNGLSNSNIRIGQKLSIPDGKPTQSAAVNESSFGVDPVVTGSAKQVDNKTTSSINSNEENTAPKRTGISDFRWPVRGRIVTGFGEKQGAETNDGIDISVPEGTAVRAAENGVVIYTGTEISMYGKLVLVRHEDGWVSAYAHNRDYEVTKGEQVRRGQIIARSGKTGETDRPKVHFELRKDSNPVDPEKYLTGA